MKVLIGLQISLALAVYGKQLLEQTFSLWKLVMGKKAFNSYSTSHTILHSLAGMSLSVRLSAALKALLVILWRFCAKPVRRIIPLSCSLQICPSMKRQSPYMKEHQRNCLQLILQLCCFKTFFLMWHIYMLQRPVTRAGRIEVTSAKQAGSKTLMHQTIGLNLHCFAGFSTKLIMYLCYGEEGLSFQKQTKTVCPDNPSFVECLLSRISVVLMNVQ